MFFLRALRAFVVNNRALITYNLPLAQSPRRFVIIYLYNTIDTIQEKRIPSPSQSFKRQYVLMTTPDRIEHVADYIEN